MIVRKQGKFRGVPFYYEKVDSEIGRRTALKEFPGSKDASRAPAVRDLGLATRRFTMEMFVVGDDSDADRDELRKALEKPGPGELLHPYWGKMTAAVHGPVRVSESTKQRGLVKLTATFVEAGDELRLVTRKAPAGDVRFSAAAIIAAANEQFARAFAVVGAVQAVVNDAINTVQAVASAVNNIRGKIAAMLQVIDDAKAAIDAVVDNVTSLVQTPGALATSLIGMSRAVVEGALLPGLPFIMAVEFFGDEQSVPSEGNLIAARARVDALMSAIASMGALEDEFPELAPGTAQQQELKRTNQGELLRLVKAHAIGAVSEVAAQLEYESYDQAQAMRVAIHALIDDLLANDGLTDELYGPLCTLRAGLTEFFASVAAELPELSDYTPKAAVPALVLAYQLYGDSTKEADILSRNRQIRDPSAVPAGVALKVLGDG